MCTYSDKTRERVAGGVAVGASKRAGGLAANSCTYSSAAQEHPLMPATMGSPAQKSRTVWSHRLGRVARLQELPCTGLQGRREAAGDPLMSWRKTFFDWFCNTLKDECATFEGMCCHKSGVENTQQWFSSVLRKISCQVFKVAQNVDLLRVR